MSNTPSISIVMNTYNAERLLEESLESVKDADEIIICDMHSTDKTIEIAEKYNAKVYYHDKLPQPDPARNFAISKASGDWILILDADEIVPQSLWKDLKEYSKNPESNKYVLALPRKTWFLNRYLESNLPDFQYRFFKKGHLKYEEGFIHVPPIPVNSEIKKYTNFNNSILHYSWKNYLEYMNRTVIYAEEELKKCSSIQTKHPYKYLLNKILDVLKLYLKNKGYKDGFAGFIFYIGIAIYNIYILQLEKTNKWDELQIKEYRKQEE